MSNLQNFQNIHDPVVGSARGISYYVAVMQRPSRIDQTFAATVTRCI